MIKNLSNKKLIATKSVVCNNILSKAKGLMFTTEKAVNDTAWIFTFKSSRRVGITMLFVFYPIDIIFLDEKNIVIEIKEGLKPFSYYNTKNSIYTCIELKRGTIKRAGISVGNKIRLQ